MLKLLLMLLALALVFVLITVGWLGLQTRSLAIADQIELTETFKRWKEAGSPQNDSLKEFMKGRRADLVVTNLNIAVGKSNYIAQFALTEPKSGHKGTLFISQTGVLIWREGHDADFEVVFLK